VARQPTEDDQLLHHYFCGDHEILEICMEKLKRMAYQTKQWNGLTGDEFRMAIDSLEQKLKEHHALEEELLFPALTEALGYAAQPVVMMTQEHHQLLNQLSDLREESRCCESSGKMLERLRTVTNALNRQLCDHMHKEEKLIFPMAEHLLSKERKHALICSLQEKQRGTV
jgi:hemerythrin-like domain-containing protein